MDRDVADGHGLPEFATTAVPVAPSVWDRLRRGRHIAVSVPTSDFSADEWSLRIQVHRKHCWFPWDQILGHTVPMRPSNVGSCLSQDLHPAVAHKRKPTCDDQYARRIDLGYCDARDASNNRGLRTTPHITDPVVATLNPNPAGPSIRLRSNVL